MHLSSIGKHSKAIEIGEEHARACTGNVKLHLERRHGQGFEIIEKIAVTFAN